MRCSRCALRRPWPPEPSDLTSASAARPGSTTRPPNNVAARSDTSSSSAGTWDAYLEGRRLDSAQVGAKAFVSGTVAANAQVVATSRSTLSLVPPEGVNFAGGKLVVYAALAGGDIRGNATLDLKLDIRAYRGIGWDASGSDHVTIGDQAGSEEVEFDVVVNLPTNLDSTRQASVDFTLVATANANIAPAKGQAATAIADARNAGRISGFRVLNAGGQQISGFTLSGSGARIPERAAPPSGLVRAVEFYNAEFAHFFISSIAEEIALLDEGKIAGWQRTGQSFNVYSADGTGRVAVCRFFSAAFLPKSSHFYAPRGLGCEGALADPAWQFEGDVFYTPLPDAGGDCPAGTLPVYRLYNNGRGGAPNHRFTTNEATRLDMLRDGYIAEGAGVGVGMCAPE